MFFFFNDTATTEIYTLSHHDALPICIPPSPSPITNSPGSIASTLSRVPPTRSSSTIPPTVTRNPVRISVRCGHRRANRRSEEHTSELQSRQYLVCRLLLEKKNKIISP